MDQREHAQMFGAFLPGGKMQHAFDGAAVIGLPGVGLPLGLRALGKDGVEDR